MSEHAEQTVEAVADAVILAETTSQPPEPENAPFERNFTGPERNPFFGWNQAPHPIRHYGDAQRLPNRVRSGGVEFL